jgi:hypothetical protein
VGVLAIPVARAVARLTPRHSPAQARRFSSSAPENALSASLETPSRAKGAERLCSGWGDSTVPDGVLALPAAGGSHPWVLPVVWVLAVVSPAMGIKEDSGTVIGTRERFAELRVDRSVLPSLAFEAASHAPLLLLLLLWYCCCCCCCC